MAGCFEKQAIVQRGKEVPNEVPGQMTENRTDGCDTRKIPGCPKASREAFSTDVLMIPRRSRLKLCHMPVGDGASAVFPETSVDIAAVAEVDVADAFEASDFTVDCDPPRRARTLAFFGS